MKIAIAGLGLIGGSIAKAIKKNTDYPLFGYDISKETLACAVQQDSIDGAFELSDLDAFDFVILGLYPDVTINFIKENADRFKKGAVVIDTCGVKAAVVNEVDRLLYDKGVRFLGCHPMAGREYWGFDYSLDNLFDKASFIMTPTELTSEETISEVENLALKIGFVKCVRSTPKEHDKVIAFTSQLAHIVSSAYIKSPSLLKQSGFSAGSFKDLTRVAKLNEDMWTTLFLMNRAALVEEIDYVISHLEEYKESLKNGDAKRLRQLLKEGRELKELSNMQG